MCVEYANKIRSIVRSWIKLASSHSHIDELIPVIKLEDRAISIRKKSPMRKEQETK